MVFNTKHTYIIKSISCNDNDYPNNDEWISGKHDVRSMNIELKKCDPLS